MIWSSLVFACIILGFVALVPWSSGRANFFGYYSVCSFTPFATITLLTVSGAIYAYTKKQRRALRGAIVILIVIVGFIGWWFYVFGLPMRTLEFDMVVERFWIGTTSIYDGEQNASSISFSLTVKNPTDRGTPVFIVEPRGLMINDKKLTSGYFFHCRNGNARYGDFQMFYKATALGPHGNLTLHIDCRLLYEEIGVEGATRESIWASLTQSNFTFSMSGILTVRPFFRRAFPMYMEDRATWAARQFVVSQHYSG